MTKLDRLIYSLRESIKTKGHLSQHVRYPHLLIEALVDLKEMIGNDGIKDDIAAMTNYFIINSSDPDLLLNSCIYGPPGVGKTEIARKIGNILYAIGFINNGEVPSEQGGFAKKLNDEFSNGSWNPDLLIVIFLILQTVVIFTFSKICSLCGFVHQKLGLYWLLGLIGFFILSFILLSLILYFYVQGHNEGFTLDEKGKQDEKTKGDEETHTEEETREKNQEEKSHRRSNKAEPSLESLRDIVQVVSREHFVDQYVGWTDKKTIKLLKENTGKVLVIDEAYTLYNSSGAIGGDSFGMEALTALNRYLSENPKKLVVIFAGYEDKMKNTIFKQQPGLGSRCIFHFRIPGYSANQLFEIFQSKISQDRRSYVLDQPEQVKELFQQYESYFKSYGRDCQRLFFYCRLEYNNDMVEQDLTPNNILTYNQIKRGIMKLRDNDSQVSQPDQTKSKDNKQMLSALESIMQEA